VRALEVFELTGRPISQWQSQFAQARPRRYPAFWLDWPRPILHARIEQRIETMMQQGLLEEVRRLAALPHPLGREARQALGYKELLGHVAGRTTLEEAVELLRIRTRQFAKRQMTWFRNLDECRALAVRADDSPDRIADRLCAFWSHPEPIREEGASDGSCR
jgi:tRNA dimethylallyltransferase